MTENKLKFLRAIALEYRLSLENICSLLNLEPSDENKLNVYKEMTTMTEYNPIELKALVFLLTYETPIEDEKISCLALRKAKVFIFMYNKAKKSGDKDEVKKVMKSLSKTDIDFKELIKSKNFIDKISEEDIQILSRYRLKYCISKKAFSEMLNISRNKLDQSEKKIKDEILQSKLSKVSDYLEDIVDIKKRKSK